MKPAKIVIILTNILLIFILTGCSQSARTKMVENMVIPGELEINIEDMIYEYGDTTGDIGININTTGEITENNYKQISINVTDLPQIQEKAKWWETYYMTVEEINETGFTSKFNEGIITIKQIKKPQTSEFEEIPYEIIGIETWKTAETTRNEELRTFTTSYKNYHTYIKIVTTEQYTLEVVSVKVDNNTTFIELEEVPKNSPYNVIYIKVPRELARVLMYNTVGNDYVRNLE